MFLLFLFVLGATRIVNAQEVAAVPTEHPAMAYFKSKNWTIQSDVGYLNTALATEPTSSSISLVKLNRYGNLEETKGKDVLVEVATAYAFLTMAEFAHTKHVPLRINSGFRTNEQQMKLYNLFMQGKGAYAAAPGRSNHQSGLALDIDANDSKVRRFLDEYGPCFGFVRAVTGEKWHREYSESLLSAVDQKACQQNPKRYISTFQRTQTNLPVVATLLERHHGLMRERQHVAARKIARHRRALLAARRSMRKKPYRRANLRKALASRGVRNKQRST